MLLVAAERGLALVPASAAGLHVDGVVFKDLEHHGGDNRLDADPERPVELHAIWSRGNVTPVVRRALDVVTSMSEQLDHTFPASQDTDEGLDMHRTTP
jgi:DNA-binding transcriptional LysR family regulator